MLSDPLKWKLYLNCWNTSNKWKFIRSIIRLRWHLYLARWKYGALWLSWGFHLKILVSLIAPIYRITIFSLWVGYVKPDLLYLNRWHMRVSILHDRIRLVLPFGCLFKQQLNIKYTSWLGKTLSCSLAESNTDNYWGYTLGPNNVRLDYSLKKKCCLWATDDHNSSISSQPYLDLYSL